MLGLVGKGFFFRGLLLTHDSGGFCSPELHKGACFHEILYDGSVCIYDFIIQFSLLKIVHFFKSRDCVYFLNS